MGGGISKGKFSKHDNKICSLRIMKHFDVRLIFD